MLPLGVVFLRVDPCALTPLTRAAEQPDCPFLEMQKTSQALLSGWVLMALSSSAPESRYANNSSGIETVEGGNPPAVVFFGEKKGAEIRPERVGCGGLSPPPVHLNRAARVTRIPPECSAVTMKPL